MKKWEYEGLAVPANADLIDVANQRGEEGWELVTILGPMPLQQSALSPQTFPGFLLTFKREALEITLGQDGCKCDQQLPFGG